jgi:transcriptional regulator
LRNPNFKFRPKGRIAGSVTGSITKNTKRNEQILLLRAKGKTLTQIGKKYGITRQAVSIMIKRAERYKILNAK